MQKISAAIILLALLLYPPLRMYGQDGVEACIRFFAADAFYYLGVAHRTVESGVYYTFDGVHTTNGFHPLWQYGLTFGIRALDLGGDREGQIRLAFALSVTFTTVGGLLIWWGLARLIGAFPALLVLVPGPFYMLQAFNLLTLNYGSIWSFMNGMETPLVLFWYGLFLVSALRFGFFGEGCGSVRTALLSVVLGLLVLSRLDCVFILLPFCATVALRASRARPADAARAIAAAALPAALMIGCYLAYNILTVGVIMPVSGSVKTGFALPANLVRLAQTLLPFDPFGLNPAHYPYVALRVLQMFLPLGVAAIILGIAVDRLRRDGPRALRALTIEARVLVFMSVFVAFKACYHIFNTADENQGHWYYPLGIIFFNHAAVSFLMRSRIRPFPYPVLIVLLCLAFMTHTVVRFTNIKRTEPFTGRYFTLWRAGSERAESLRSKYDGRGIIEFDDGIISYALDVPAMSGLGFTLDAEALAAKREGRFLELARQRGFTVLAAYNYLPHLPQSVFRDPAMMREALRNYMPADTEGLMRENLDAWEFRVLDFEPRMRLIFIEFSPVRNGAAGR